MWLKTHAGSASSLNPVLKGMFRFYHQFCYWFNTCLYMFNGEPSISTVRIGRVTIKYRAQICLQSHTHMDSSICCWYLHQQSSRIWLCMNRMFTFPTAYLHMHNWRPAPEQMWALGLSWHSRMTETPIVQEMPWKCSDEMVRITNKYSPETHLHTGTHSKYTGLTHLPQILGK